MPAKRTIPAQESIVPEQQLTVDVAQTIFDHAQRTIITNLSIAGGVDRPPTIETVVTGPAKFDRARAAFSAAGGRRPEWLAWLNTEENLGLTITP